MLWSSLVEYRFDGEHARRQKFRVALCEEPIEGERERRIKEKGEKRRNEMRERRHGRVGIKFLKFPPMYAGKSHSTSPRDI